jgi:phosphatidylglycerophosphate synthase
MLIFWLASYFNIIFVILILIRELLVSIGGLFVLKTQKTVKVTNKGKAGTALIFISLCLSVLDPTLISTNTIIVLNFVDFFLIFSIIFYYFVALEYLYKLINKNE